jgi:hypothetical protein
MPTYNIDLVTERGLERVPFTLDDDRPLGPQLRHVLEELRQQGIVLKGGPEDELFVAWNGRSLDLQQAPETLRIAPLYSIELRMQRRTGPKAVRPEPPAKPFLPKGAYIGLVAGLSGGAIAWLVGSLFTDLGTVLVSYGALDLTVAAILGGFVGAAILGFAALRRNEAAVAAVAIGLLLGALGTTFGALLGLLAAGLGGLGGSRQGFVVARLLVWGLAGGFGGLVLGARWFGRDRGRLVDGLLFGVGAGALGGLIMSLPGPTDLWQLIAFVLVGSGLGYGLSRPARALGMVELETVSGGSVGLLRHREWEVLDNEANAFGRRFQVRARQGQLAIAPTGQGGDRAVLAAQPITGPTDLLNDDVVVLGEHQFRFRRFPEASL